MTSRGPGLPASLPSVEKTAKTLCVGEEVGVWSSPQAVEYLFSSAARQSEGESRRETSERGAALHAGACSPAVES